MQFQPKFMLTFDLYNYFDFFEKILFIICKIFVKQLVFVVEFRQVIGMLFYDDGTKLTPSEEINIF